jgi:hypothetical protein
MEQGAMNEGLFAKLIKVFDLQGTGGFFTFPIKKRRKPKPIFVKNGLEPLAKSLWHKIMMISLILSLNI